jgi:hypothetical protein
MPQRADAGLPPGLEVRGAEALGVGWDPRDRLVAVDGAPVVDHASVVQQVLAARERGARELVATVARRTPRGVETYEVIVEQPYLGAEEAQAGEPSGPTGRAGP